jgi:hypothetical protein
MGPGGLNAAACSAAVLQACSTARSRVATRAAMACRLRLPWEPSGGLAPSCTTSRMWVSRLSAWAAMAKMAALAVVASRTRGERLRAWYAADENAAYAILDERNTAYLKSAGVTTAHP